MTSTDRDLLLGLLAVENGFISRDALVRAGDAWAREKPKRLGQVLLEQQALDADGHAALEALVQKHVEQLGDDAWWGPAPGAVGPAPAEVPGTAGRHARPAADP